MHPRRYHSLAILLHWVMAVAFILMLASGIAMTDFIEDKSLQFRVYQWHKSLGVLLLIAFLLRLVIRLVKPRPALLEAMKPWEKRAAELGHFALYGWMVALPLTGWLVVSSSVYGLPTIVFGLFEWPHIPAVAGNKNISEFAGETHELLAYSFMLLIVLHVAAVVKHWVIDKENLLPRMGIGRVKE